METFQWDKSFETGIEPIDDQHRRLVGFINRFSALVEAGDDLDPRELVQVHEELADYAAHHFKNERDLLAEMELDSRHTEPHLRAHGNFIEEISRLQGQTGESLVQEARHVLKFVIRWLAYHILGTDQAMARQIAAIRNGFSPRDAFASSQSEADGATAHLLRYLDGLFEVVSERNRRISTMNRELERKVADRTRELSQANQDLQRTTRELAEAAARLETMAMTDLLTGLFNRRYAMTRLESELAAARRHGEPLALVLLDADGFKAVNDTFGHDAGDAVIEVLGATLRQLFRAGDVVCRMGGDEFLVICPRIDAQSAFLVAERVRAAVNAMQVKAGMGVWHGSISAGIAALEAGSGTAEALIKAADNAVYEAKRLGRNRVVLSGRAAGG